MKSKQIWEKAMEQKSSKLPIWIRLAAKLMQKIHNPLIPENPKPGKWYRVPMPGLVSSEGSPYFFSFRKGTENKLMVFLQGGGVSWNAYMAARPMDLDAEDLEDVYYFPKALDYGATGSHGILSGREENPFRNWNIISLPYCTGDFHCGTGDFPYIALDGCQKVLHHHGYINTIAAVKKATHWIGEKPEQLVVTGNSAGGFGAALMTDAIMGLFPECSDVTCLVDSGIGYQEDWPDIVKNVWEAPREICQRVHSDCFVTDCLEALKKEHGDRVRILFTCSVRDLNLAQLIGFGETGKLYADEACGKAFQTQMRKACAYMTEHIPDIAIYLFDTPVADPEGSKMGLTRHCILPDDVAFTIRMEDTTVIQWLTDAMNGKGNNIGLNILRGE